MAPITFFVAGSPAPKGSTRAFVVRGTNRAIVTETTRKTERGGPRPAVCECSGVPIGPAPDTTES